MKVDKKVTLGMVLSLGVVIFIAIVGYVALNDLAKTSIEMKDAFVLKNFASEKESDHLKWIGSVSLGVMAHKPINVQLDHTQCGLGKWIYESLEKRNYSNDVMQIIHEIEPLHKALHASGRTLLDQYAVESMIRDEQRMSAIDFYQGSILTALVPVAEKINAIKKVLDSETRILEEHLLSQVKKNALLMIVVSVVAFVLVLLIIVSISRSLAKFAQILMKSSRDTLYGSQEISTGNQDLAARTEEQASSLEETASTVEQVTSTVKQTADNSQKASQFANRALGITNEGAHLSENVKSAMNDISESSNKIADIVRLVDEIAFQTNILAINAAIEAAKAGEQGKGFAVVAIEVRDLAQRSAEAAKDIKMLIDSSIEKVEKGVKLVGDNAEMLKEIAQGVQQVNDIMGEISAASKEQYAAIEQINKAVTQLDVVTQQNSSLVEEIASTSANLNSSATIVDQLVRKSLSIRDENKDHSKKITSATPSQKKANSSLIEVHNEQLHGDHRKASIVENKDVSKKPQSPVIEIKEKATTEVKDEVKKLQSRPTNSKEKILVADTSKKIQQTASKSQEKISTNESDPKNSKADDVVESILKKGFSRDDQGEDF